MEFIISVQSSNVQKQQEIEKENPENTTRVDVSIQNFTIFFGKSIFKRIFQFFKAKLHSKISCFIVILS